MALQKQKTLTSGVVGNYWKITEVSVDRISLTAYFKISLYLDKATSDAGAVPINYSLSFRGHFTKQELAGDIFALGYSFIKEQTSILQTTDFNGNTIAPTPLHPDLYQATDV